MLKFLRKEERKHERKEGEKKGKKVREDGKARGKKGEKVKGQNRVVSWERRRKCVKVMKALCLLPGRKTFFEPCKNNAFSIKLLILCKVPFPLLLAWIRKKQNLRL